MAYRLAASAFYRAGERLGWFAASDYPAGPHWGERQAFALVPDDDEEGAKAEGPFPTLCEAWHAQQEEEGLA